MQGVATGTYM